MSNPLLRDLEWYHRKADEVTYVIHKSQLKEILEKLGDNAAALDFETTALSPSAGRVRLSCIYHHDIGAVVIDHDMCGSFNDVAHLMLKPLWYVYNAKFETQWFKRALRDTGLQADIIDVDFLAKVKRGGGHSSLAVMAKRDLGIEMDKTQQMSDWSLRELSAAQIKYAALDAVITYSLAEVWLPRLSPEQIEAAWQLQETVLPTVECEQTGMMLDEKAHKKNVDRWTMKRDLMVKVIRRKASKRLVDNLNSKAQISAFILAQLGQKGVGSWPRTEKTKQLKLSRDIVRPIAARAPYPLSRWLNAYIQYNFYQKYLSTYGETLMTMQYLEGKISYRLNIAQAATGRYSSSSINIQNIPRSPKVRKAFRPPEGYEYFVVADYSGVEVRVLAELSQDVNLLRDVIFGNVHASAASAIYQIDEQEFLDVLESADPSLLRKTIQYIEMRSKAKGFTFQLTYGAAAPALAIVLKCTVAEAEAAIVKWATRYPKAYEYRFKQFEAMSQSGFLPVCDGREIFVHRNDRTIPVAANYGIQGAAASVMNRAMHHVYQMRNAAFPIRDVALSATVHDELILAVRHYEHVAPAKDLLVKGMQSGWLDIFPGSKLDNLVEAKHGRTWGDAK